MKRSSRVALVGMLSVGSIVIAGPMPAAVAAAGCESRAASHGVYTQPTSVEYSNKWSVSARQGEGFYWYLRHTDGSLEDNGYGAGSIETKLEPANNYYLQIYNSGLDTQTFDICYWVQ